jgi:hypothetical protein
VKPAAALEPPKSSAVPRTIEAPPPRRPPYFWWLLANALALCFAVVSWTVCLHVFGNPEIPRNYEILRKIGRLPELKRFTVLDAPNGSSRDPKSAYSRFYPRSEEELKRLNSQLIRNYLTNFEKPLILNYIEGDFQVERVRPLEPDDFVSPGFAIRARAMVKPDDFTKPAPYPVIIEYVFPTHDPSPMNAFKPGDILSVQKSPNCAAIVHVERVVEGDDPMVCLTVVPIAYGSYEVGKELSFEIEPPKEVRPAAAFPLFKDT